MVVSSAISFSWCLVGILTENQLGPSLILFCIAYGDHIAADGASSVAVEAELEPDILDGLLLVVCGLIL